MGDATPARPEFMDGELARFLDVGAWERGYCAKWVSRLFLVPKPGTNKWRLFIDLRPLNRYCETRDLSFETLSHLRNLARPRDYMLQMDLQDGFYAFLYLAIAPARFYLRELHDVLKTRDSWSGRVKPTRQLERNLQWWVDVPTQHNGRPINRPVEIGCLHVDSWSYGSGVVLNEHHEARGFWYDDDRNAHITLKELKAVRLAIESFLPMLQNRHIRLHENNQAVVGVLTNLTSRSPRLMAEPRKTWYLKDTHGITLSVRYIRSAANIWSDRLSSEVDCDDWQFNPRRSASLTAKWGACTIDRFATSENALLPRYNARWRDPRCEAVDALRLSDAAWRCERN
eukprot:jgi/Tetstr1/426483/TSEL_016784.t1